MVGNRHFHPSLTGCLGFQVMISVSRVSNKTLRCALCHWESKGAKNPLATGFLQEIAGVFDRGWFRDNDDG